MKKYWDECENCHYKDGKKVHKIECYYCRECTREGKPLFSEKYGW